MDGHALLLGIHVTAGTTGLLVGAAAMAVPKRPGWHTRLGVAYQVAVAVMTSTAVALVLLAPGRLWGLGLVAVATEVAALAGWAARRRHRRGWVPRHVRWTAGSYVSFVTAALVVNWASPLAWVLPTVVGTPLIARAVRRAGSAAAVPPRVVPGTAGGRG